MGSDYLWKHITVIAGVLVVYVLFIGPFVEHAIYKYKMHQKKRQGTKLGAPYINWSIPFGIPNFVSVVKYVSQNRLFSDFFLPNFRASGHKTIRNQGLGSFHFITSDPENLKHILAINFDDYNVGTRHGAFYPLLGNSIFTLDGAGWKHSRELLRPHFMRQEICQTSVIEKHLQTLMGIFDSRGNGGTEGIEIQDIMMEFTLDIATEFLFGFSTEIMTNGNPEFEYSAELGESMTQASSMLANRARADGFYNWIDSREFRRNIKLWKDFAMKFVNMALEKHKAEQADGKFSTEKKVDIKPTEKYVFLDELVKETQDPSVLQDQTLSLLMAGRDTTSSLVSWVLYYLALKPEVFAKLRTEVLETFGTGQDGIDNITFESLKRAVYLRHVLNETLRVMPLVPANLREASCDTTLPRGGRNPNSSDPNDESYPVFIPKGTPIILNTYVLQHDTDFWGEDADVFRPERWEEHRPNKHMWDFLPFSGGPRICLGQQFALHETSYIVVRMLQNYEAIVPAYEGAVIDNPATGCVLAMKAYPGIFLKFLRYSEPSI